MLSSIDGKINSGVTDNLDVDQDWAKIDGLKEGLPQYYNIEQTTDLFSFNTGRVLAKIGINEKTDKPPKSPVTFIIVDNKQHLGENGIKYLCAWLKNLMIVTTNENYQTFGQKLNLIHYDNEIDFHDLFKRLKQDYEIENVTIQSGGTMNGVLLREKLLDFVNLIFAPVLVGGKDTPSLIDGYSLTSASELEKLGILKLIECKVLNHSYINIRYEVIK
jgi:2,5-diamino-6-(ribosylamino)-4(3H)-pyrimidinone 5'-phosphate reductase